MDNSNKNIVRDRTLILRVLVPGLHTSLNDKINAKNGSDDGDNNNNNNAQSNILSSAASALVQPNRPGSTTTSNNPLSADQIFNLDGVSCLPSKSGSTLWNFRCDGATYPARLVNLPCPIEVHKTHDHANYHKAADIGQMLIVYEDERAMEEAENEKNYTNEGFPSYYHSGITPPMKRVVERRYLSRFEERDTKPIPPPKSQVSEVEKDLQSLISKLAVKSKGGKKGSSKSKAKPTVSSSTTTTTKDKVIEEIEEEIVDYEPWMGEGGVFTIDDAKMHPEWFLTSAEIKEIESAKRSVEEERIRLEQEAIEAARAKEEEERKKAEKKKKKKDKKKAKAEAAKVAAAQQAVTVPLKEMDDVTAAAMTINEGLEGDEDFLFGVGGDDMFDFENEDISDLLG